MKIHLLSDLHLELNDYEPTDAATDADVIVLAGDIHTKARGVSWAFQFNKPVIYVPGNHEYYGGHLDNTLQKMRDLSANTNVHVLDNDSLIIDGICFLGATAWTDYSATSNIPLAEFDAQAKMNDFKKIRARGYQKSTIPDFVTRNHKTKNWLRQKLDNNQSVKTVVVTHHAPCTLSLNKEYDITHLDAAYANCWEELVYDSTIWLHGHTHYACQYDLSDAQVYCNPRGYRAENTGFNPNLIIEV